MQFDLKKVLVRIMAINLKQEIDTKKIKSILSRYGINQYKFNRSLIESDIKKFNNELESGNPISNIVKNNLREIIRYLETLIKNLDKVTDTLTVKWSLSKDAITTNPLELYLQDYLAVLDYMILSNDEQMVTIDYAELADIIAFEIMHRDLGETFYTIEDKLEKAGIIIVNDSKILTQHFEDSPYKLSKVLRVSDSPHIIHENKKMIDFFGMKQFDIKDYKEVVKYSCQRAILIIVDNLLSQLVGLGTKFKLCGISETAICLVVEKHINLEVINSLAESVIITVFGRKFESKPKIYIFKGGN